MPTPSSPASRTAPCPATVPGPQVKSSFSNAGSSTANRDRPTRGRGPRQSDHAARCTWRAMTVIVCRDDTARRQLRWPHSRSIDPVCGNWVRGNAGVMDLVAMPRWFPAQGSALCRAASQCACFTSCSTSMIRVANIAWISGGHIVALKSCKVVTDPGQASIGSWSTSNVSATGETSHCRRAGSTPRVTFFKAAVDTTPISSARRRQLRSSTRQPS
jgi:hypothetical protein